MNDDAALLRSYAEEGSEAAFTELVGRHVNLVYSSALRRTGGDPHRAADVSQQVFTALARQARKLSHHPLLSAWLHAATRNTAVNLMISEQRRKAREFEALARDPATAPDGPDWERVRPVLDAAVDELPEADRGAIILRFLEQRSFAEVGAALRVTGDAARMRTERALDKLRAVLARDGISSTAAALGAVVAGQSALSAPAGLVASLSSTALSSAGTSTGIMGTALALFMSTKTVTSVVGALVAIGIGIYLGHNYPRNEPPPPAPVASPHIQTIASLREGNLALQAEVDRLNAANATLAARLAAQPIPVVRAASAPPPQNPTTFSTSVQQKALMNNLRMIAAARDQFQLDNGRPPKSLDELVGETKYLRQLNQVDGESYAGLSLLPNQPLTVMTPAGISLTYDPSASNTAAVQRQAQEEEVMQRMAQKIGPDRMQNMVAASRKASEAYSATHKSAARNPEALIPYFATPQEGADFVEVLEMEKEIRAELKAKYGR